MISERTGLRLDPYFTGTKLSWVKANETARVGRRGVRTHGEWAPVDSYLDRATDPWTVACHRCEQCQQNPLYNLSTGEWGQ